MTARVATSRPAKAFSPSVDARSGPASDTRPVTLLLAAEDLPVSALDAAFEEAARRHTTLRVMQLWPSDPAGRQTSTDQTGDEDWLRRDQMRRQEQLDFELAGDPRSDEVGVIAELSRDPVARVLAVVQRDSQLLVLPLGFLTARLGDPVPADILSRLHCPLLIVPDAVIARDARRRRRV